MNSMANQAMNNTKLSYCIFQTPLGWVGIVASSLWLRRLILPQATAERVLQLVEGARLDLSFFGDLPDRISHYLQGEKVLFPDRVDFSGATTFQQSVWQLTRSIPYGETRSYTWVAEQLGKPRAYRAVGQALAKNPLPLIIPCHRVIASRGSLGGYRGGIELKKLLLGKEGSFAEAKT